MNERPSPPGDTVQPAGAPAGNPYQDRVAPTPADLDAGAPYLQTAEVQRLNRKALVFLGAIVLVLGAFAVWLFSGDSSAPEAARARPQAEQIVIPAAPRDLPELPEARPAPPPPELPPLPVIDDERSAVAGGGMPGAGLAGDMFSGSEISSLLERRMQDASMDRDSDTGAGTAGGANAGLMAGMMPGQIEEGRGPPSGPTSAQPLYNPDTLLLRGTYIRCILQSRVISDFPGYTSCIVTEPVYSVNGRRLLLPRGSKVMGYYNSDSVIGDRAAIVWDRITTPTGLDVNMMSPGVDALGAAGNEGHYTAHWGQRITSALLISMLSDAFKYVGAKNGPQSTTFGGGGFAVQNPYESNTARTMERLANLALERNMSRPPTVTINQGALLNVYVARDVDFSAVVR